MKEKHIRIIAIAALSILLVWNLILSIQLTTLQSTVAKNAEENNATTQIESDLSSAVAKSADKTVTVSVSALETFTVSGAGIIYQYNAPEAIIITNASLIAQAASITVIFANQRRVPATVVGTDPWLDLAVLRVEVDFDLEPIRQGDASVSRIGEWVVAIGAPKSFTFMGEIASGIIIDRSPLYNLDETILDNDIIALKIQMDLKGTNTGGPVVNMAGEMIGLTSSLFHDPLQSGVYYVIPINELSPYITKIIDTGVANHPLLGINGRAVNDIPRYIKDYWSINLDQQSGIFVYGISATGAAYLAGVREHDIILQIDGEDITTFRQYRRLLNTKNPGETMELTILRNGEQIKVQVILP
ncbi:MAG: S1C family serine protease [Erysipelotrichaceae bacterium]|jgi:serine protease Do|nr:S1C family serine protease [Erysipelotrichaceae bacterium]